MTHRADVVDPYLAYLLATSGTRNRHFLWAPGDGSRVQTDEFDAYRILDRLIHEVHARLTTHGCARPWGARPGASTGRIVELLRRARRCWRGLPDGGH